MTRIVLLLAIFLSSPVWAHGDSNGGLSRLNRVDYSDPIQWGHSLPRSYAGSSRHPFFTAPPAKVEPLKEQAPVPYLIDINRMLDPWYDLLRAQLDFKEVRQELSTADQWEDLRRGFGLFFICTGGVVFLLCMPKKKDDKDELV